MRSVMVLEGPTEALASRQSDKLQQKILMPPSSIICIYVNEALEKYGWVLIRASNGWTFFTLAEL